MATVGEAVGVSYFGEGSGGGPGSESGDCYQDLSKRVRSQLLAEVFFYLLAVGDDLVEVVGEVGDDPGPGLGGGKVDGLGFHRFPDERGGFVG